MIGQHVRLRGAASTHDSAALPPMVARHRGSAFAARTAPPQTELRRDERHSNYFRSAE
ncbi:hypothetical protein AB0E01_11530 [Nocardia vinacea]|uniref:hypothetical protein n=1 Tax=Nocardia vinacea TaxID=96468 RepID=UPI0033E61627